MVRQKTIHDLFRHMEWADALLWKVIFGSGNEVVSNEGLLRRLRHIHWTESAFLSVWKGETVDLSSGPPREAQAMMNFARSVARDVRRFVEGFDESGLDEVIEVPWARRFSEADGFDPAPTTWFDTFYQLSAHGVHHRAQINTLLRELGITPPLIDYIGWVWRGRPEAEWPETLPAMGES